MIRLLKLEYYKNLSYRPFKIFTILYFVILGLLLFVGLVDFQLSDNFKVNLKEQGMYNFPAIWNFTTYIVAVLKIFLGFIIIFSVTQEFTNRMFKQNIIDGLSRGEFLVSKLLTITIYTAISTLIVFIITLFLGYQYSEKTDSKIVTEEMFWIGNYFVKLFVFFSFLTFLSILFRKSVFVFLALFVWWFIEGVLSGIETVFKFKDVSSEKEARLAVHDSFFYTKLLPLDSMSALIPSPLMRLQLVKLFGGEYVVHYPAASLIASLIWGALFIFGSYWILKKRDW